MRLLAPGLLVFALAPGCHCALDPLAPPIPRMIVSPEKVDLTAVPVAQDTRVVIRIFDASSVQLIDLAAALTGTDAEGDTPRFKLVGTVSDVVDAGQAVEVVVVVRPVVVGDLHATVVLTAEKDARPNKVEVPISVHAIDAGLPDICGYEDHIELQGVGKNSVGRASVTVKNCGTRDLTLDQVFFCADLAPGETGDENGCGADTTIRATVQIVPPAPGAVLGVDESTSLPLTFAPLDLELHSGNLVIESNDPDENPVVIPVFGTGQECPTACIELVDGATDIQPFDTVRIDGRCSAPATGSSETIESYAWSLAQRPVGSTNVLQSTTADRTELEVDLAGRYCVDLNVTDTAGVGGCQTAETCFDVVPTEDLHIQLVWDHPSADLDLHVLRQGGTVFTHEDDCYFSNRHPLPADCAPAAPVCSWVDDPNQNPSLDHDDHDGYGPENTNIVHPAPQSCWSIDVHYWNKQTDGDPRTAATVRVFVYGQQVMEVQRTFEDDQQLWHALDLCWPAVFGDPATLSQIGVVEPFARPF